MKLYKYCLRCGRLLKNPEARIKGFGVVCEKKMKQCKKGRLFDGTRKSKECDEVDRRG